MPLDTLLYVSESLVPAVDSSAKRHNIEVNDLLGIFKSGSP